ncbi:MULTISPECIES: ABC transporter ATP-binding protein [Shewanella]|uniref:ABC transporter ATP-binding protein n=1 Tax=Shewanella fidelis TaxID=173509 RepID=A0AAW8NUZ1_9GAMM|nr:MULTISPECIES: ABC transporter ATP-binding protein [Shewanella]MDR8525724.1 ABC transporter ATP-binding protein [Shewanella fidelis]MDW4812767.1 ABC transporter ATP-binding protein [Shewanella fidelis]MDW4816515.1 ABC transporter ATP-binding protein [Shewanella fidelis]MDW4820321.1 ABC transporter ATP-binding protein [Shewanella fidelis]MDW4825231.1 ABC transporter ATP-binding protein [Shewanella fidelis]
MSQTVADLYCRIQQTKPIKLDAEFVCKAGEVLAVVGPSGGGKSTLLRMIAGLSQPEQGEIRYGDKPWFNADNKVQLTPQQRHLGYVPQHFGLFPNLTALENVVAALDHIPKAEREARAKDWLERVNLHGLPDRLPAQLSGGQRQRVALARALAREPSVLLLDEPFSAVDRETRERLYLELARLKEQLAIPVIMVTHDLNEALLLADSMILISQGKMLQQGRPREVLTRPRDEAVAKQMGLRNIFDAEVIAQEEERQITWLKFGEHLIASTYFDSLDIGTKVRWVIPNQGVRFNSIKKGRLCRSFNKLDITVDSMLVMGESVRVLASVVGVEHKIHAEVPLHLAQQLELVEGSETTVALKSELIHILEP